MNASIAIDSVAGTSARTLASHNCSSSTSISSRTNLSGKQHADLFPERLQVASLTLPLTYQLDPGQEADGVTVSVPEEALGQLGESQLDWLVPGLLEQKVLASIRALPKPLRRFFVPAPESARLAAAALEFGKGDFLVSLAQKLTHLCGERIDPREFDRSAIPDHLQFNIRVLDPAGRRILEGRELRQLRTALAERARSAAHAADDRAAVHGPAPEEAKWMRTGFRAWDFGELPEHISIVRAGIPLRSFPALRDDEDSVALMLCQTADEASLVLRRGLRRLTYLLEKNGCLLKSAIFQMPTPCGCRQRQSKASTFRSTCHC
ncbi:MAG UNVERIFIED_CONTAM: DUF3418 domain-containing protein [Planctomycetaceae bacterium]